MDYDLEELEKQIQSELEYLTVHKRAETSQSSISQVMMQSSSTAQNVSPQNGLIAKGVQLSQHAQESMIWKSLQRGKSKGRNLPPAGASSISDAAARRGTKPGGREGAQQQLKRDNLDNLIFGGKGSKDQDFGTSTDLFEESELEQDKENFQRVLNMVDEKLMRERQSPITAMQSKQQANQQQQKEAPPTFSPMLSKKSMKIAERLGEPMKRLLHSKEKTKEKIQKLRAQEASSYKFRPEINQRSHQYLYLEDQGVPRWQRLYEYNQQRQQDIEHKRVLRERELETDPDLTFQPNIYQSKHNNLYYQGELECDIIERSSNWQQQREEKICKARQMQENKNLSECTFYPQIVTEQRIERTIVDQVSDFNRKGIIEYFERVDIAKKKKREREEAENKQVGNGWYNRITVPKEFNFMRRQGVFGRGTHSNFQTKRSHSPNSAILAPRKSFDESAIVITAKKVAARGDLAPQQPKKMRSHSTLSAKCVQLHQKNNNAEDFVNDASPCNGAIAGTDLRSSFNDVVQHLHKKLMQIKL